MKGNEPTTSEQRRRFEELLDWQAGNNEKLINVESRLRALMSRLFDSNPKKTEAQDEIKDSEKPSYEQRFISLNSEAENTIQECHELLEELEKYV